MPGPYFSTETFAFLDELKANNARDWFERNKPRYREHVQEPAVRFVTDFAPHLARLSSHFRADPRPIGGSIFRIYRDTRFSKDKSPYKTHIGIQFRHERAKDAYAPGFYLHIAGDGVFMAVGSWHPDTTSLKKIRTSIIEKPAAWKRVLNNARFRERFELSGDSLVRAPAGVDPEHALIDDIKRKDFVAVAPVDRRLLSRAALPQEFATYCRAGAPLVRWICAALDVPF